MTHDQIIAAAKRNNARILEERGPGLRYDYQTYVLARDRVRGYVYLGGLGSGGAGAMWFEHPDRGSSQYDTFISYPGYGTAPEMHYRDESSCSTATPCRIDPSPLADEADQADGPG